MGREYRLAYDAAVPDGLQAASVIHSDAAVKKDSVTVGRDWHNPRMEITVKEMAAREGAKPRTRRKTRTRRRVLLSTLRFEAEAKRTEVRRFKKPMIT
jgi:hypothetical protein